MYVPFVPRIIKIESNNSSNKKSTNSDFKSMNIFDFEAMSIGMESCNDNSKDKENKKNNILNTMIGFE